MKFYEFNISCELKYKIHFQNSLEVIGKSIASYLIEQGFDEHSVNKIKGYVFSNFSSKAENGFYSGKRSF